MATLYRKKNAAGKYVSSWYCAFRVPGPDGVAKQVHRSTGKTTKKEAEAAARILEDASLAAAGAGDDNSRAIMERLTEAGELAMRGRLNPARAIQIIQQIRKLGGDESEIYTVRSWTEEWMRRKKKGVSLATFRAYHTATDGFIKSLGDRADAPLDMMAASDVQKYLDDLGDKGLVGATCNNRVKMVRTMFRDAVKEDLLIKNPAVPIGAIEEEDSITRLPFTSAEVVRLRAAAPSEDWHGVMTVAAYTGLRLGDISRLTTDNLDMKELVITVVPSKTKRKKKNKKVEIPMHPEIVAYLKKAKVAPFKGTPIFPTLHGVPVGGKGNLSEQFTAIMTTAAVDRKVAREKEDGAARDVFQKGFHSFRHTFTSWLAAANVPEEVRAKMTGHTDTVTHQIYTHLELGTLRGAIEQLEAL